MQYQCKDAAVVTTVHRKSALQGGLQLPVGGLLVGQPQLRELLPLPPHPLQPLRSRLGSPLKL